MEDLKSNTGGAARDAIERTLHACTKGSSLSAPAARESRPKGVSGQPAAAAASEGKVDLPASGE